MTLREVSRWVRWPKLLQPRPTAETRRPEPPRLRIFMDQCSKFLKERMIFRQIAYTLANHALGVKREKGSRRVAGPSKLQDGSPMALMQVSPVPIAVRGRAPASLVHPARRAVPPRACAAPSSRRRALSPCDPRSL